MIARQMMWNRRSVTRRVLAALGAGLLALPALGCSVMDPTVEETRTSTLAHVAGSPLSVESANGSISVATSTDLKEITVVAKLKARTKERLEATKVLAERKPDSSLSIYVKWPGDSREGNEGCSFEIRMPDVKGVSLQTSNGSVTLSGSSGAANVKTSNGSVTVSRHDGEIKIKTSNGSITGSGVNGPANLDTSNGSVSLSLAPSFAGPVEIDTSNGAVTLGVGSGFAGELSVKTSNGAITLPSGPFVKVASKSKGSAKLSFGEGGKSSKIATSNASVTVSRAD